MPGRISSLRSSSSIPTSCFHCLEALILCSIIQIGPPIQTAVRISGFIDADGDGSGRVERAEVRLWSLSGLGRNAHSHRKMTLFLSDNQTRVRPAHCEIT